MQSKKILTVENLLESLQKCPKDSRVFLAVVPLSEAAGIVGVQNCEALNFETRQMEPVVFMGIRNFTALAQSKIDANTFNARMIINFMNNWDSYKIEKFGIAESRLDKYRSIMEQWRQDRSMNVERKLADWLANCDDPTLDRLAQIIAQSEL